MSAKLPILYVKTGCPWCQEALDFLKARSISHQTVNVSNDAAAMKTMQQLSGQSKCPTLDWNGEILADFGVDELEPFLEKRGVL